MTSTPARVAVITVSDGVSAGTRADGSGDAIANWVAARGHALAGRRVTDDSTPAIVAALLEFSTADVDVIITTGGTGFTRRDVTPEATASVIDRPAPGIAERVRSEGARMTPHAMLSRGVAGIRGTTLIVNLPGSTGGVNDGLLVLDGVLDHAVQLLRGIDTERHG